MRQPRDRTRGKDVRLLVSGPSRRPGDFARTAQMVSDILRSGWAAAERAGIEPGDTVAVWGCGPVGLFAIQSAFLLGAARVIAIDELPHRLDLARRFGAEPVLFEGSTSYDRILALSGGVGPQACIDATCLDARDGFVDHVLDQIAASIPHGTGRARPTPAAIYARQVPGTR